MLYELRFPVSDGACGLGSIVQYLGDADINIEALLAISYDGETFGHIVLGHSKRAVSILQQKVSGLKIDKRALLEIDTLGLLKGLKDVTKIKAIADVNINSIHMLSTNPNYARLVLTPVEENLVVAERVLNGLSPVHWTELTFKMDDESGQLYALLEALETHGVCIHGLIATTVMDNDTIVKVITEQVDIALRTLEELGVSVQKRDTLEIGLPTQPNSLAVVLTRLFEEGINLHAAYLVPGHECIKSGLAVTFDQDDGGIQLSKQLLE